jgi:YcxB-like protein
MTADQSLIELRGKVTLGDFVRCRYLFALSRTPWASLLLLSLCIILAPRNTMFLAVLLLLLAIAALLLPFRAARKQFADGSYLNEPVTFIFDIEGIRSTGSGVSSSVVWSRLQRVQETKTMFLLYYNARAAVIIPKRFFEERAEMMRWRQLVTSRISPKSIRAPSVFGRWF